MNYQVVSLLITIITFISVSHLTLAIVVSHDGRALIINGERKIILSGAIHYPRSTPEMWPNLIKKAKEGGLDAIETYVFWNAHEQVYRQYDFTGRNDLVRFIKTIQDAGLYAILRIGPYACAEWNYGGFPVWLHNLPGIQMRTNNTVFMDEMQTFTTYIVKMMKENNLFAPQGGPIILSQIENEYGNIMSPYGDAGKEYIKWCAKMAVSQNIGIPWVMCQQSDAPQPMINTCNGFYCHDFKPNNSTSPKMWTENWTGWFKNWGGAVPHRTAEDVAYSVARFFETGGTLQNYYMYHGGTNFGRTTGGPYITTSYDYDAPLDEYGNLNQPKWGHLKQLHLVLHSIEKALTYGDVDKTDMGNNVTVTTYTYNKSSSCFISNANSTGDATITLKGHNFNIPSWSVSILPDCQNEVYNTAKVNTQTSILVKKSNVTKETNALTWSWRREKLSKFVKKGEGDFSKDYLLEQKAVTNDSSDYLWYMASVNLEKNDIIWSNEMKLYVNSSSHVLHVYVNGREIGYQHATKDAFNVTFERKVNNLKTGNNIIAILSATVGLKNYGSFYDTTPVGVTGPVHLLGKKDGDIVLKNLSSHVWSYKTGLHGVDHAMLFSERSRYVNKWRTNSNLPINTRMTWYKTTFKTPVGNDAIVVDLTGMGKGIAWVNGVNIGRYWPSYVSNEDKCKLTPCDYRGPYDSDKCVTDCKKPIQTEYHVPRSLLKDDVNTLVLFEEFGGNPSNVNFKTIDMAEACATVYEGNTLELTCDGRPISAIKFASFGNPQGICGNFAKGSCEGANNNAQDILTKACVGQETCTVDVSEKTFGAGLNCQNAVKKLAVEIIC